MTRCAIRSRDGARLLVASAFVAVATAAVPARAQTSAAGPGTLDDALAARLSETLAGIARGLDGVVGYAAVDLETGRRVAALADTPFPTASSIKIAILYELARQADEGRVDLDEPRPVPASARVGGSGILQHLTVPALTARDLATLMIVLSDNTATNVLIDLVGRDAVNARMQALELPNIRLRRKMMDAAAQRRGEQNTATPGELPRSWRASMPVTDSPRVAGPSWSRRWPHPSRARCSGACRRACGRRASPARFQGYGPMPASCSSSAGPTCWP